MCSLQRSGNCGILRPWILGSLKGLADGEHIAWPEVAVSMALSGCFVGVLGKRALLFGVYVRAPDFWELPERCSSSSMLAHSWRRTLLKANCTPKRDRFRGQ